MIGLDTAKAHLNVTTDDDDALIRSKIGVAAAWIALYTGTDYQVTEQADGSDPDYPAGITYVVDTTPAPINEAILQLVAHLYANREASLVGVTAQSLPFGLLDLLSPYRAYAF